MAKSAAAPAQTEASQGIEYSVYVFEKKGGKDTGRWEKSATLTSLPDAQKQAEELFNSGKYGKVEIKQKFFDKKKDRNVDVTLKVLERKDRSALGTVAILVFAVLCGVAAFAITYFLKKGG